jgi:hypothetical protein
MIEIRTYDGEPAELAAFCTAVWRDRYRDKMTVPLWNGPFFEWELFSDAPGARDYLVAAYDGGRLVGALPSKPVNFHWQGQTLPGSFGSFFSVDPAYEKQAISLKLVLEQRRRHRARNVPFFTGYVIRRDPSAMGPKFWKRLPDMYVASKLNLWIRMLDHRTVGESLFSTFERRGSQVLGWFQLRPKPPRPDAGIRPYRDTDLPDCLRLVNELSRSTDFGLVWDEATLARQLSFKEIPRTIVTERDGRVAGFVNYCLQPYRGRAEFVAGVIDLLVVGDLPFAAKRRLLWAALYQMASEGCHAALRSVNKPDLLLFSTGFILGHPPHDLVIQSMTRDAQIVKARRIHALWR